MRNFIFVNQSGEIDTCIETNNLDSLKDKNVGEVISQPLWNKIREKPYYFKFINNQLVEKSDQEKKIEDDKRKSPNLSLGARLTKIENRLSLLEQNKK